MESKIGLNRLQYLYILDYCDSRIIEIKVSNFNGCDLLIYLNKLGIKESNIEWMITDKKLKIEQFDFSEK